MAKRYSVRPSELLNSDTDDFQIDFLCFDVGFKADQKNNKKANKNKHQQMPRLKKI